MKDISPILRSLGLADSEIKTYMAALEQGPSTPGDLAKKTHLSRQGVYSATESLSGRGLMSNVLVGKKRHYVAAHPSHLLDYARRRAVDVTDRIRDLERTIPELELQMGGARPVVKVYEGKEGIYTILGEMTSFHGKQSFEIADLDALYAIVKPEELLPLRKKLQKTGIHLRGIYAGTPATKVIDVDRYILPPHQGGFQSNISVYGNKIALVTFEGKIHSVLIESEALAKALRTLFGLAFETAKKNPEQNRPEK